MSQNHFHLPDRTSWVLFSLARRRISLAPGNRTTVNVEPCYVKCMTVNITDILYAYYAWFVFIINFFGGGGYSVFLFCFFIL